VKSLAMAPEPPLVQALVQALVQVPRPARERALVPLRQPANRDSPRMT